MEWKGQMAALNVLDRIVALLLAIADLAERAAGAPAARRRLVLAILRSGEAVARDAFRAPVSAMATQVSPSGTVAVSGDGPEDALALAMSLRALALIVRAIAAPQRRLLSLPTGKARHGISEGGRCPGRSAFRRRPPDAAFPPAQPLDTS